MFLIHFKSFGFSARASLLAIITDKGVFNSWEASAIKSRCFLNASSAGLTIHFVRYFAIKKNTIVKAIKNTIEPIRLSKNPLTTYEK